MRKGVFDVGDGGNLTRTDVRFDDFRGLLSLLHGEDERGERRQQGGRLQRLGTADAENVRPDAIVGISQVHLLDDYVPKDKQNS